jgi:UPF0288 family protein (methanogenesis marker protein 3)
VRGQKRLELGHQDGAAEAYRRAEADPPGEPAVGLAGGGFELIDFMDDAPRLVVEALPFFGER